MWSKNLILDGWTLFVNDPIHLKPKSEFFITKKMYYGNERYDLWERRTNIKLKTRM